MTQLGFKRPDTLTHVTSNATVVTDIAYRRIVVKQGIAAVEGKTIRFVDGTAEEFDVLIAATGYLIDLDFIPPQVLQFADNRLELYMRIVPPEWPGLYFMGFFNTDTALNMVFEHQARWVRELLLENARLPERRRDAPGHRRARRLVRRAVQAEHPPQHRGGARPLPDRSREDAQGDVAGAERITAEIWETVHVTLRRRCGAAVGGRIEDVSLRGSWRCGRPA